MEDWVHLDELCTEIRRSYRDFPYGYIKGGLAKRKLERKDESLKLLETAVKKYPDNANSHIELIELHLELNQLNSLRRITAEKNLV